MYKKIIVLVSIITICSLLFINLENPSKAKTKTLIKDADFSLDITNKDEVVGNSENVFIGKVIKQVGTKKEYSYDPQTQFEVEVVKNIKGELVDNQIVNQDVGYYIDDDGKKYLSKFEKQEFLIPGEEYLFATIYSIKNDWHNPIPYYGELPLKNKDLKQVEKEYKTAFKNQKISEINKRHKDRKFDKGRVKQKNG